MEGTINTNGNNEDEDFYEKMQRIQAKFFEQNELNTILEKSKMITVNKLRKSFQKNQKKKKNIFQLELRKKMEKMDMLEDLDQLILLKMLKILQYVN